MKISVITVCRNAAEDLLLTAKSVVAQENCDLEYIIVDGASTDNTQKVIREIEEKCVARNIVLKWISEPDNGIYDAMNKGTKMASGDFVCYMNAGDTFAANDVVKRVCELPEMAENDVIYGSVIQKFDFGNVEIRPAALTKLQKKMAFCHQSCFIRTDILKAHPYNLQYPLAADYELVYWCYTHKKIFLRVDFPIACFESEKGASSKNRLQLNREFARISGRYSTWKWRFEYVGKCLEVGFNKLYRSLIPKSQSRALREKNYRRIQQNR